MKFKEWLKNLEEDAVKSRPQSTSNVDRSALYGLAAQYGHPGTMSPISWGLNNKAVAGLGSGIGSGIAKEFERTGRRIVAPPNIAQYPEPDKKVVEHGTLPLQLPWMRNDDDPNTPIRIIDTYSKNMFVKVYSQIKNPLRDPRVRKMGEDVPENSQKFLVPNMGDLLQVEQAKAFTRTLIQINIANNMSDDVVKKYDVMNAKIEAEDIRNGNLICAFSFSRRDNVPDQIKNQGT